MAKRSADIVAALSAAQVAALARALRAESEDPAAILAAMRSPDVAERLQRVCESALMLEDLALLCANPFAPVAEDELVEAAPFADLGLIVASDDGGFEVNIDMALSALRSTPAEFGFAATLLARLDGEDLALVRNAVGVGPRPSRLDAVLDVAETSVEDQSLMRQIAHLRAADRKVLEQAMALGELDDDVESIPPEAPPPMVTLDPGPAGRRGLVFWIEHEVRGLDARPVVPLEVLPRLEELLARVPPSPDVVERQASRRRAPGTGSRVQRRKTKPAAPEPPAPAAPVELNESGATPPTAALFRRADDDRVMDPVVSRIGDAAASRRQPTARNVEAPLPWSGRTATVASAGALVELDSPRVAEAARRDDELGGDVLELIADTLVVLRAGVDPRDWAERCALRFGL